MMSAVKKNRRTTDGHTNKVVRVLVCKQTGDYVVYYTLLQLQRRKIDGALELELAVSPDENTKHT